MAPGTSAQTSAVQQRLLELKEQLQRQLNDSAAGSQPVGLDQPIGRLSRVDALQQQAMAMANRDALKRRLVQIDAALQALRAGDYGDCRICEEPIGTERLQAYPDTPFCLACQQQSEQVR